MASDSTLTLSPNSTDRRRTSAGCLRCLLKRTQSYHWDTQIASTKVGVVPRTCSSPAAMQASKAADAYGLFEGHSIEQADARQAYTQSRLGGTPTW
eukprot:813991-Pyramimonas_sp.AAC.1